MAHIRSPGAQPQLPFFGPAGAAGAAGPGAAGPLAGPAAGPLGLGPPATLVLALGSADAAAALAAGALRSMMPESSRSLAVVTLDADEPPLGATLVSALSEKSIEFSSRWPGAAAAGGRAAIAAAPLRIGAVLVATSSV